MTLTSLQIAMILILVMASVFIFLVILEVWVARKSKQYAALKLIPDPYRERVRVVRRELCDPVASVEVHVPETGQTYYYLAGSYVRMVKDNSGRLWVDESVK